MDKPMNKTVERLLWVVLAASTMGFVLSGCAHRVKPDDMSVAAHQREAARENARAASERSEYVPTARREIRTIPSRISNDDYFSTYNPTQYHLARATQETAHAKQHLAAAAALERLEARECQKISVNVRGACPLLGPIAWVETISGGVRLHLSAGAPIDAVLAHMRCHLAYAEARGYEAATECLIYIKGAEIRAAADGQSIEVVAHDRRIIDEIRKRSRELPGASSI